MLGEKGKKALVISNPKTDKEFISSLLMGRTDFVEIEGDGPISDQIFIPRFIVGKTKRFFSIYPKFPVVLPLMRLEVTITVADMIGFTWYQKLFLRYFSKLPHKIVTISDACKREIEKLTGRSTTRIYQDLNYMAERFGPHASHKRDFEEKELRLLGIEPYKYLLYVGNFNPHKNVGALVEAFVIARESAKDLQLVLAGGGGRNEQKFDVPYGCKIFRFPDDDMLGKLYRNALAVVVPSISEGLGIPPLEACYFGKAVLVSDIEVFRETVGECAAFFDPKNKIDIAKKLLLVYQNERLRKIMEEKSKLVAKRFTSFRTGKEMYDLVFS